MRFKPDLPLLDDLKLNVSNNSTAKITYQPLKHSSEYDPKKSRFLENGCFLQKYKGHIDTKINVLWWYVSVTVR